MTSRRPSFGEFGVTVAPLGMGDRVVVAVHGEVDMLTAPVLDSLLQAVTDKGYVRVVLDLGGLEFIDAAGLRVIAEVSSRLRPPAGLTIRALPARARRVFDLSGMTGLVAIERASPAEGSVVGALAATGGGMTADLVEVLGERLRRAFGSQQVVAEARGVLMERLGVSADVSEAMLAQAALDAGRPVVEQAAAVVASVVGVPLPAWQEPRRG